MDNAWKTVYEQRARSDIPDYRKSCWSKEGFEELLQLTLKFVDEINTATPITTILDVGSGPGVYCDALHQKGFLVTGVDYAPEMVALAKKNYPDITFSVGDGYCLTFADNSFDLVISIGALQCLLDHERFLRELCRVSRKHLIISTLWREDTGKDPAIILKEQLEEDSWPTREYHSNEVIPILESAGFSCTIIREQNGKEILDGYFIIAQRKE